jgi:chromosomal replication initiation ATPase DnaA
VRKALRTITIEQVLDHVAWEFGVETSAISSPSRRRWLFTARCAVVWLARRHTNASVEQLAAALRCKQWSTAWWHRRAHELVASSADARALFLCIDGALGALS